MTMAISEEVHRAEKAEDIKIENSSDVSETRDAFDSKEERKLRHRVDWRLIPALG